MRLLRTLATVTAAVVVAAALVAGPASADSDVTVPVVADTYTASTSPSTSYGGSSSLGVYSAPEITALLRVVIPSPPAGEILTSASLVLHTTTIASAGSASAVQVRPAEDTWDESTTVYSSRPAVRAQTLGTLPGGTTPGSRYVVALDVAALASANGSTTLALVGTGTDSSWFWSRNAAAAVRPALTLRYSSSAPPDTEPPSTPMGVSTSVRGAEVTVTWNASTDSVGVAGYRVHRGTTQDFAPSASTQVGAPGSTSFTERGTPAGDWFYRVVAVDSAGNASAASAAALATVVPVPTTPVTAQVVAVEDAMVVSASPTTNYGSNTQLAARGQGSVQESFLRFALPEAPVGMALTAAVLSIRTSTDPAAGSADVQTIRLARTGQWRESTITWSTRPTDLGPVLGTLPNAPSTNSVYAFTLDATQLAGLVGTSQTFAMTAGGSDNSRWWSREAPNPPYRPTLALTFEGGDPPPVDTQPPSVPMGVSATVSGTSVALAWQPSSDDTAVTGYLVHRGSDAGFTPTSGTRIADVQETGYVDRGRPAGTWYYRVIAYDAAQNASSATAAVAATVQSSGPPVTRALPIIADLFTAAGSPSTNYGTSSSLGIYGTPAITTLMRVQLPAAPDGAPIIGAVLRVRTTTISSAGSADEIRVRFADDAWSETSTVYNNRPAVSGAVLGALARGTAADTAYDIRLDAGALAGRTGSVTFALEGTGGDSTWLWSREATNASYRPVLSVTYQGGVIEPPPPGLTATVMAVGDIACRSGDPTTTTACRHGDVADLIAAANPSRFIALGDIQYQDATLAEFRGAGAYDDTFGRLRAITLPVLGNHEYHVSTDGYFDYFYGAGVVTGPFGDRGTGYYTTTIGSWRFIGLNTECGAVGVPGGCRVGSPQYDWLQNLLVNAPAQCTIVAAHRPRWSTGASHGSYPEMSALWDLMAANGVDIVLSGHNHVSEIFKPIGVSGSGSTPNVTSEGIRAFTAGGGGASIQGLSASTEPLLTALDARSRTAFGPLKLTLNDGDYSWQFLPVSGMTFTNSGTTGSFSGSGTCR